MVLMSIQAWKLLFLVILLRAIGTDHRLMRSQKSFGRLRSSCETCELTSSTGGTLDSNTECSGAAEVAIFGYNVISPVFQKNKYLEKVSADASCVRIESSAFEGCSKLREVSFPGLRSVGGSAFENSGLETFTYSGNDPILFESSVFKGCASLRSVVLSAAPSTVESSMFDGCVMLTELSWPATVSKIGNRAFCDCNLLNPILKYAQTVSLGPEAFANSGLKMFDVRNKVGDGTVSFFRTSEKGAGENAFEGCQNLRSFAADDIGTNMIPSCMFMDCSRLETLIWPRTVGIVGERAFQGCSRLAPNLKFDAYEDLGDWSFSGCGLVTFTTSTTNLGTNVFQDCVNLKQFTYSGTSGTGTSDSIPNFLVAGCVQLTDFKWEPEINSVGISAFQGCSQLVPSVKFSSVVSFSDYSMSGCGYETFDIDNVGSFGSHVFENCTKLKDFAYHGSESRIPGFFVAGCVQLTRFQWDPAVSNVGESAFRGCSQLEPKLEWSQTTVTLGDSSFSGCAVVSFTDTVNFRSSVFADCVKLQRFEYSGTAASIPPSLFAGCVQLTKFKWTPTVNSIGDSAFKGFHLLSLPAVCS